MSARLFFDRVRVPALALLLIALGCSTTPDCSRYEHQIHGLLTERHATFVDCLSGPDVPSVGYDCWCYRVPTLGHDESRDIDPQAEGEFIGPRWVLAFCQVPWACLRFDLDDDGDVDLRDFAEWSDG